METLLTMEIGDIIKNMDKVHMKMKVKIGNMTENGIKTKNMVMEFQKKVMKNMKVNGNKIK